jgi:hypothetical protein
MKWTKLTAGPHAGKTLPEVFFTDPHYLFTTLEAEGFEGDLWHEAVDIRWMSPIRVPRGPGENQDVLVLLRALPDHRFGGYSVIEKCDPRLPEYIRFSVGHSRGLDFNLVRILFRDDPEALGVLLGGLKFDYLGDPNAEMSPEECIGFFEDPSNFVPPNDGYPPRLERAYLRPGTVYRVVGEHGLSDPISAERTMQVGPLWLAFNPGEAAAYVRADGVDIVTWWEDEPRDGP